MTSRLLSIDDVLDRLPIGRTNLWTLPSKGEIESCKLGSRRLVPEDALDAYIERLRSAA
jgi:excisionase family DNA binding protein